MSKIINFEEKRSKREEDCESSENSILAWRRCLKDEAKLLIDTITHDERENCVCDEQRAKYLLHMAEIVRYRAEHLLNKLLEHKKVSAS